METRGTESGSELVLDNRKLIIGFLMLIAVCGVFFVIGFMEGKRQAVGMVVQNNKLPASNSVASAVIPDSRESVPSQPPEKKSETSFRNQLDWYNQVQSDQPQPRVETANSSELKSASAEAGKKSASEASKTIVPSPVKAPKAGIAPAKTAKIQYTLQAGAFLQRREAESNAEKMKAKGIASQIEEPKGSDSFYRVRVGAFDTRAEAVAMQRKLAKAGFNCIIKTR
jgi:cell division protein FtsN